MFCGSARRAGAKRRKSKYNSRFAAIIPEKYTRFNRAIESLCRKSSYTYVDTTDIFRDHPNFYAGDGIHASTAYYPLWMDEMIRAAGLDE